jgi:translation elongation factor EF-Tu-like GTPase
VRAFDSIDNAPEEKARTLIFGLFFANTVVIAAVNVVFP